jgi:hypothetical protein
MKRGWLGCGIVALIFAALLVAGYVRSCAPSGTVRRGDFVISTWASELPEYIRFAIPSERAGVLCIDTNSEDYKQPTIAVLTPRAEGFQINSNDPVGATNGWLPKLYLYSGELISLLIGSDKLKEAKKQLYFRHTGFTGNQQPGPEESAIFPILSKGWPRRVILPDGDGMLGFHLAERTLYVHRGKGAEIQWTKQYSEVLDLAPLYLHDKLTYALINTDGEVQAFNRSTKEFEPYKALPKVPEDLKTALAAKARQTCIAGDMLVWRNVTNSGVNEYHIQTAAGSKQTLLAQDEFAARSIFRIFPKLKRLEEAARSDPEVSNFVLRKDGRRQPADVVATGARIMPLDEETIMLVDNNYQRITTIRKAD